MTLFIHRNAGGRCPCGAENATCGPPSNVVPVDQLIEEVPAVSGPLKKYRVTRGGVETVMKLSDADAERLGVGVEQALDAVSTIEPVELVTEEAGGDASEGDDGDAGDDATVGDGDGAGAEPVQQAADAGGDGQAPAAAAPAAPVKKAAAKKTAAKRAPTAANKARTSAPNKAADGGS